MRRQIYIMYLRLISGSTLISDIFLVVEYAAEGFYPWAGLTLALVVVPTLIVEVFSIRWHSLDGNASRTAWTAHFLCLGIAHRYVNINSEFAHQYQCNI